MYNPFFIADNPTVIESIEGLKMAVLSICQTLKSQDEIIKELKKYLDELEDTVKQEVKAVINEMYENGEISDIIENFANEYFNASLNKSTAIDFRRIFRDIYETGENNTTNTNTNQKTYCQGSCFFERGGVKYAVVALKCSNHSTNKYDNTAVFVTYNLTAQIEISRVALMVGHGNSICYDNINDNIYIAFDYINPNGDDTQEYVTSIGCIPFSDLLDGVSTHYTYKTAVSDMTNISTVAFYDGQLYVGDRLKIAKCDFSLDVDEMISDITYLIDYEGKTNQATYIQDMTITDKYIFLLSHLPQNIYVFDKESKHLIWVYNIPDILNAAMYRSLECESISAFNNGDIYLFTGGHTTRLDYNAFDIMQIFKQNLYHNDEIAINPPPADRAGRSATLTVDSSSASWNPDGSTTNPFKTIQEAIMFVNDNENITRVNIELASDFENIAPYICSYKSIFLYPIGAGNALVGGLALEGCTNFNCRNLTVQGMGSYAYYNASYFNVKENAICARNGTYNIANCVINANNGVDTGIIGKYLFMNYSGNSATTEDDFTGTTFMDFTDSTINARGKATLDTNIIA